METITPNKPENPDCAGLRQQLQQARAISDRNKGYFGEGGQYRDYASIFENIRDTASLAALAGSISATLRGLQLAPIDRRGIPLSYPFPEGTTRFPNRSPHYEGAGSSLALLGAGIDGFSLGVAINEGDGTGALLPPKSVGASLKALRIRSLSRRDRMELSPSNSRIFSLQRN